MHAIVLRLSRRPAIQAETLYSIFGGLMKGAQLNCSGRAPHATRCHALRKTFLQGKRVAFSSSRSNSSRSAFVLEVEAVGQAKAPQPPPVPKEFRFRLNNLAPQPGSRDKETRKGRGYGAGQGGSCGFGMRGQNSRSGPGTRPGFEGGQMPLYRRVPKLKGICGGMSAGVPKHVVVNLRQLAAFKESEEISLDLLKQKNILNVSGKEAKLPLKILGDGDLSSPLTIKAEIFSDSARKKIEKAGGTCIETPKKIKWTRGIGRQRARVKAELEAKKPVKQVNKPKPKAKKV